MRDEFKFNIQIYKKPGDDTKSIDNLRNKIKRDCREKLTMQVLSFVQNIINESKIEINFHHDDSLYDNEQCLIEFFKFEMTELKLEKYGNIFAKFHNCQIDLIDFSDRVLKKLKEKKQQPFQRFRFNRSTIKVLDYSKCNLQTLDLAQMFEHIDAKLLVLPEQLQNIKIKSGVKEIKFLSNDYLQQLEFEYHSKISCANNEKDYKVMNLQKFTKLVRITLPNIQRDILLPNQLEALLLSQGTPYQYKILNTHIMSQNINMTNFSLLKVQLPSKYNKLILYNCMIQDLIYSEQNFNSCTCNLKENLVPDRSQEVINIIENDIKNLVLSTYNIKKIYIKDSVNINVNYQMEGQTVLYQEYINCLDFTNLQKITEIHLETSKYYISLGINNIFSILLESVSLKSSYKFQTQENTVFDFSHLLNLQNVNIQNFNIKSVIFYQNKLKFEFNPNLETGIQIESQPHIYENQCLFTNFITNISKLKISGLTNLIIEDQEFDKLTISRIKDSKHSDILDFRNFTQLTDIYLSNIQCRGIIFGNAQLKITFTNQQINAYKRHRKMEFLDFRNCQKTESCLKERYDIRYQNVAILYLGNCLIDFFGCEFQSVQFCQNLISNYDFSKILQQFRWYCKYVVAYNDDMKQRILYKISTKQKNEQQQILSVNKAALLVYRLDHLYKEMKKIIND